METGDHEFQNPTLQSMSGFPPASLDTPSSAYQSRSNTMKLESWVYRTREHRWWLVDHNHSQDGGQEKGVDTAIEPGQRCKRDSPAPGPIGGLLISIYGTGQDGITRHSQQLMYVAEDIKGVFLSNFCLVFVSTSSIFRVSVLKSS